MEIAKIEIEALENTNTLINDAAVKALSDLELALVGGGGGDILWT